MAFAVADADREMTTMGRLFVETVKFTELATDTGGSFTTRLSAIRAVLVGEEGGTATAIRASFSGRTVTVTNVAGPTSGYVMVIGF